MKNTLDSDGPPVRAGSVFRVASVGYLNAQPLSAALQNTPGVELRLGTPREVARMLAEDEVDVALMPVAAAAAFGDTYLVPGMGIVACGAVRSVAVFSEVPLAQLETIVVDASSRTSVVLLRILLQRAGLSPKLETMPPTLARQQICGRVGALLIGDAALLAEGHYVHTYDLGDAWHRLTGLPFVFAAWFARRALTADELNYLFTAKQTGLAERTTLAQNHAECSGLDPSSLKAYLRDNIRFKVSETELRGLALFYREANELGLLPRAHVGSRFVDQTGADQTGADQTGADQTGQMAATTDSSLDALLTRAAAGERMSVHEGERLFNEASLFELGIAADAVRLRKHPDGVVTYIVDRNVNYTNVCTTSCRFCAFYRPVGHPEGYVLTREVLAQKLQEVKDAGGVQILLQGGLNPELRIGWYEDLFRWMKREFGLGLHALSPEEIVHIARMENLDVKTVLLRLHAAGLDSVPGGGAEILVDRVRRTIAKTKCTSEEWLSVMRDAHSLGLRSSATMMYGTVDTPRERVLHLLKLRDLQDETGGFTAFFCWDYQHEQGTHIRPSATGTEHYLRQQALARIMLDNIEHVGASWVTQGPDVGQVALRFGADDFGSVMFEENVVSSAGTTFRIDADAIEMRIHAAGFRAARRNVRYDWLTTPA